MGEILKQPYSQPVKISFLLRALDNLRKGESVAQSVVLAQNIISDYSSIESMDGGVSAPGIIVALEQQLGIVSRLITNIESYHTAVRERSRYLAEKNKGLPDDISNFVFVGKHTHKDTLENILGFLEFLILNTNHQVTLGPENIDKLWTLFVQQPNFTSDQTLFLAWINKHREAGAYNDKKEYYLFNELEREHFFTKILCNPTYVDFQKISSG
jgi:hypothetical protein